MTSRVFAGLSAGLWLTVLSGGASAAIWEWGCQGQLGDQQIIFNRESMVVVDTRQKMGDIRKLRMTKIELPKESPPHVDYNPGDYNGGLIQTMDFTRSDDAKRKIVLVERSSRKISHRHKLICGRDEDEDIFRKVYRFERENEPPRDITMQCFEYQLSTRGGRKGCGED
jgi:hypothetical protein